MRDTHSFLPRWGGLAKGAAAVVLAAGLASDASADTAVQEPSAYRTALTDALGDEHTALPAFAVTPDFARAAGLDRIDTENPENLEARIRARALVDALGSQDAHSASVANGVQEARTAEAAFAMNAPLTDAMLAKVTVGNRSQEWYCLTEALYFEARGESRAGQIAVAEVILNRADSHRYPKTICGVVQQGMHRRNACQFSYNCDGRSNAIGNRPVFENLGKLAWVMMEGKPRTLTGEALFYHNTSVSPRWARRFIKTARIGAHIFYRPKTQISQN